MYFKDDLDIDYLHSRLICNPDEGTLVWRPIPDTDIVARRWNGKHAGKLAGAGSRGPYLSIKLNGAYYQAHRIIYAMMTGAFPDGELDHISGDKRDNKLSNLRVANHRQNCSNLGLSRANTSGHSGVYQVRGKWQVGIGHCGKLHYLGWFDDHSEAVAKRDEAEKRLFGDYRRI